MIDSHVSKKVMLAKKTRVRWSVQVQLDAWKQLN